MQNDNAYKKAQIQAGIEKLKQAIQLMDEAKIHFANGGMPSRAVAAQTSTFEAAIHGFRKLAGNNILLSVEKNTADSL